MLFERVRTSGFVKVGITNGFLPQTVKTLQSIIIERIGINFACVNLADSGGRFLNRFSFHFCICVGINQSSLKICMTQPLLWVEYCEQCRANGDIPYQSTQFNKYYSDFVQKTRATMHLDHKPGDAMQVDWAGQTAAVVDTDTGEIIPAYLFVAVLPYSEDIRQWLNKEYADMRIVRLELSE